VGFVVDRLALGQVFFPIFFAVPGSVSFHSLFVFTRFVWGLGSEPVSVHISIRTVSLLACSSD
jgi:hypothetical protein